MERNIKEYFDTETMPEELTKRIENRLSAVPAKKTHSGWGRIIAVAASLALILLMLCSGPVTTAFAEMYDYIIRTQNPDVTQSLGWTEGDIYFSYGGLTNAPPDVLIMVTPNQDPICVVRDDRLYCIANGENMDITDLCSEEEAFVYALVDNTGVTHYFIIGGEPDNWGYQIFIYDPQRDNRSEWVFGGAAGIVTRTSGWMIREWVYDGQRQVGHPWPLIDNTEPDNGFILPAPGK